LDLTRKQKVLRKSFFVYNYEITSYCLSPGITFYSAADESEVNSHVQNTTLLNWAKNMQIGAGNLKTWTF